MVTASIQKTSGASRSTSFQHEPLDYRRGAIRLLRILPHLSNEGHIQCEIWHDSIKASYACLSYVWGSEKIQRQILVNGKLLSVRENLYDFMRVARSKYANPPRTLWIDALCIDQNSVYERNHQVAQMGSMYANAIEVISWFGFSQNIGRAFAFGLQCGILPRYRHSNIQKRISEDQNKKWLQRNDESNGQLKKDWHTFVKDRYWTRAWITQEILLARNVKFLVNDLEVNPIDISGCTIGMLMYINDLKGNEPLALEKRDHITKIFHHYMFAICKDEAISQGSKLINFFHDLPGRQSHFVHDRVFSLLSLASDASSVKVDYNMSQAELLHQVMSVYKTKMCICTWFFVADMLDCYHVPDPKGHNNKIGTTPIFRIPMQSVQTDFVMGENPTDWYDACSQCGTKVPSFDKEIETTFCIKSLCYNIRAGHLYVHQYKLGHYEIKRSGDSTKYEVIHFQSRNPGSKDDFDLGWGGIPCLYDIYLTGDVLIKLFLYPDQKVRQAVPMRICFGAQNGDANMELC
ncbi:hypothetical protein G6011_06121 [Alternaria panax]|uniref:Heterokaryon incompatibility domain-containing protein n=1 Tax=Alternaria panax TaxID=48097 RepID=A0AAD4I7T3_9PLEO|nr:hypothetical protein G6011_06121 [Alternaria panax]